MPYPKEFPHQILGIERAFARQELVKAMGVANKKVPSQAAKHTAAYHDLANTKRRLEYEILLPYGNTEMERELEQLVTKLDKASYLPQTCPALPVPGALATLGDADFEADFSEINLQPPEIAFSASYDNLGEVKLPVVFDK